MWNCNWLISIFLFHLGGCLRWWMHDEMETQAEARTCFYSEWCTVSAPWGQGVTLHRWLWPEGGGSCNSVAFPHSKLLCCWQWVHMTVSLLVLLLSIGCSLIREDGANLLLCAMTASTQSLLATWLNSWRFTKQPAGCALLLILPFFVCPLCTCTHFEIFFLCCTVCLEQSPLQS